MTSFVLAGNEYRDAKVMTERHGLWNWILGVGEKSISRLLAVARVHLSSSGTPVRQRQRTPGL